MMENDMADDQKKRFNKIVTDALSSSIYSRQIHDTYYHDTTRYSYGVQSSIRDNSAYSDYAAYIQNAFEDGYKIVFMRLVLNLSKSDATLAKAMHHELGHISQFAKFEEKKINQSSVGIAFDDCLARNFVKEIHAVTYEQEGPLVTFFDHLKQGNLQKIDQYKEYVKTDPEKFYAYTTGLFNDFTLQSMNVDHAVDYIGYRYVNGFSMNDAQTQQNDFVRARKEVAKLYLNKTDTVSDYIQSTINTYHQEKDFYKSRKKEDPIEMFMQDFLDEEHLDFLGVNHAKGTRYQGEIPTLPRMVEALNNGKEIFMPLTDWQEAIGAKDNHEFAHKIMMKSSYRDEYKKIVEQNRLDGLL